MLLFQTAKHGHISHKYKFQSVTESVHSKNQFPRIDSVCEQVFHIES